MSSLSDAAQQTSPAAPPSTAASHLMTRTRNFFAQPSGGGVVSQPFAVVSQPIVSQPVADDQPVVVVQPPVADPQDQALNALDEAMLAAEAASPVPQVIPTVIDQATQTLNPTTPVTSRPVKESLVQAPQQPTQEIPGTAQMVEIEPQPEEMSPEVEAYLQQVEQHQDQQPQEIVIADGTAPQMRPFQPPTPVVVLPITPAAEAEGENKPPSLSIRWLVEWSRRIMKMFQGKVIYRDPA